MLAGRWHSIGFLDIAALIAALQDRVASELKNGAAAMLSTPDFADPGQFSYHNYAVRYLALAAFASAAVEGYAGCNEVATLARADCEVPGQHPRHYKCR